MSAQAVPVAEVAGGSEGASTSLAVVVERAADLAAALNEVRSRGATVGFVPTMGALHAGHTSLIARARSECYAVAVSVFVNPTQFNDPADLAAYPRDFERDVEIASRAGADFVYLPSVEEVYPPGDATVVSVPRLSGILEGAARPGHFDGVATVVAKLLATVGPCTAYFGEKDYQQLLVVKALARDLRLPAAIVGCPTVREEDGLALSSRNARLSPDARYAAACLYHALQEGRSLIEAGERDPQKVESAMRDVVATEPLASLDYAVAVGAHDLLAQERLEGEVRLMLAATFEGVRLIDNLGVAVPGPAREGTGGGKNDPAKTIANRSNPSRLKERGQQP